MEKQDNELNILEQRILEESCFVSSFGSLLQIEKDKLTLKYALHQLLKKGLIQVYDMNTEDEIILEKQEFDKNFAEYYYLATKTGLKAIF